MFSSPSVADGVDPMFDSVQPPKYVRFDDRDPAQIETQLEVSALSAMVSTWRSTRTNGSRDYVMTAETVPPEFVEAITAVGGIVTLRDVRVTPEGDVAQPVEIASRNLARLANKVILREGIAAGPVLVQRLEERLFYGPTDDQDRDGREAAFYELVAVTGMALGDAFSPGRWIPNDNPGARWPFLYEHNLTVSDVFDRAEKMEARGLLRGPRTLLWHDPRYTQQRHEVTAVIRPTAQTDTDSLHRAMVRAPYGGPDHAGIPRVVYGEQTEDGFYPYPNNDRVLMHRRSIEEAAGAYLSSVEARIVKRAINGVPAYAISGPGAAAKIMAAPFMRRMHWRLGSDLLVAAMPRPDTLLLAAASTESWRVAEAAKERYEMAGTEGLTPLCFLVHHGIAQCTASPRVPKRTRRPVLFEPQATQEDSDPATDFAPASDAELAPAA